MPRGSAGPDWENKVDTGFAATGRGFAEMRGRLDQTAAGMADEPLRWAGERAVVVRRAAPQR